jgi:hypothetical protein
MCIKTIGYPSYLMPLNEKIYYEAIFILTNFWYFISVLEK